MFPFLQTSTSVIDECRDVTALGGFPSWHCHSSSITSGVHQAPGVGSVQPATCNAGIILPATHGHCHKTGVVQPTAHCHCHSKGVLQIVICIQSQQVPYNLQHSTGVAEPATHSHSHNTGAVQFATQSHSHGRSVPQLVIHSNSHSAGVAQLAKHGHRCPTICST